MQPRLLIAGIGNIFMGDDAFGVEVAQALGQRPLPSEVRVIDFGIRGIDLTYALLDGYETVILVDAAPRGGPVGTLYVLEPEPAAMSEGEANGLLIETHSLDPAKVLRLAASLGSGVRRVLLVGCEPERLPDDDDMLMGMSDSVQAAVSEAVSLIEGLVSKLLQGEPLEVM